MNQLQSQPSIVQGLPEISTIPREKNQQTQLLDSLNTRSKILKVAVVTLGVVCLVMDIFIMAKTSQLFSFLFSLGDQIPIKNYLTKHFRAYISGVYISIFGFVLIVSEIFLFFYKFSQRDKLLWMNVIFFLAFFISSLLAVLKNSYDDQMETYQWLSTSDSNCTDNGYINECTFSTFYISYRGDYVVFFIIFDIFFIGYLVVYHYTVTIVLPFLKETEKIDHSTPIDQANKKNITLVSEAFDEYLQ